MKEDKTHIDKLFNDSLNQRSFEVPDAFLEDLNKRLDAGKKKGGGGFRFWLLVFILLFTGVGIAASLLVIRENDTDKTVSASHMQSVSGASDESNYSQMSAAEKDTTTRQGQDSNADEPAVTQTEANTQNHLQSSQPNPKPGQKQTPNAADSKQTENLNLNVKDRQTVGIKPKSRLHSAFKTFGKKSEQTQSTQKIASEKVLLSGKKARTKTTGRSVVKSTPGRTKNTYSGLASSAKSATSQTETQPGKDKNTNEKPTVPSTTLLSETAPANTSQGDTTTAVTSNETKQDSTLAVNPADSTSTPDETAETSPEETNKKKGGNGNNWRAEIELFGGLGANMIHDSKTSQTTDQMKNQSSIFAPSFGVNGHASYKQFTFGTGLSYSQTGEKYALEKYKYSTKDSTTAEIIHDSIPVLVDTVIVWIPHDTTIYHTVQYQDSALEKSSIKNRYSWFSIPLYLGYRFELGQYELIPRIGAQFNFGIGKNTGSFPGLDTVGTVKYPAVKFNVSYLIQLEARRNFDHWYVFVNPYFKSMINPAVSGDVIRRRYSSWGIQFGIGLKL